MGVLSGIRVLDFSQGKAGPYCTKLLADYGADVVKAEPPAGDEGRALEPLLQDGDPSERSALFAYLNANKRSIVLDLDSSSGLETAHELIAAVDVVVESFAPGFLASLGLGYEEVSGNNPAVVVTSVTPWGQDGPYRDYEVTDLIAWAASGAMYSGGLPGREPLRVGSSLSYFSTGMLASIATMAALLHADSTGEGQHVDVSQVDGISQLLGHWDVNMAGYTGAPPSRQGRPQGGPVMCKDGYIGVNFYGGSPHHWSSFCAMTGMIELLDDPRFATPQERLGHWPDLAKAMEPWLMERTREEVFTASMEWQLPFAYVPRGGEVLGFEQHEARSYFQLLQIGGREVQVPGAPARLQDDGWELRRLAPRLGEHSEEVLAEYLGNSVDLEVAR